MKSHTTKNILFIVILLTSLNALAQNITTSPFGKGVGFYAADSTFSMKFQFRTQSLFTTTYDFENEDLSSSMMIRRSRLKFGGFAFSPKLEYKAELGLTSSDVSTSSEDGRTKGSSRIILDAVLKYHFSKHWEVWFGQSKLPGNRERVVSSADLQFVDRSLVNSKFNIDRDAGIWLYGQYGKNFIVRPRFAVTNGEGRDIATNNEGGFNYTARLELLPLGAFKKKGDYVCSDIYREETPKVALGFTYNFNNRAVRQQGQLGKFVYVLDPVTNAATKQLAEVDLNAIQADLMFKYNGFSILSEYANTQIGKRYYTGSTNNKFNTGSGFNAQGGYLLKNNIEFAYRFTNITYDDKALSGIKDETEHTLCVSKYFVGHNLKIQSDAGVLFLEGVDMPTGRFRFQVEMQF